MNTKPEKTKQKINLRQYEHIWLHLKKNGEAVIVAPIINHSKIIQAVKKEKWRDLTFKLLQSEKGIKWRLQKEVNKEKRTITFKLIDTSNKIKVSDL